MGRNAGQGLGERTAPADMADHDALGHRQHEHIASVGGAGGDAANRSGKRADNQQPAVLDGLPDLRRIALRQASCGNEDERLLAPEKNIQRILLKPGMETGNHAFAVCAHFLGPIVDAQNRSGRIAAGAEEGGFVVPGNVGIAEGINAFLPSVDVMCGRHPY